MRRTKTSPSTALWIAAINGNIGGIRRALDSGAAANAPFYTSLNASHAPRALVRAFTFPKTLALPQQPLNLERATPALLCACLGRHEALELLLSRGAMPDNLAWIAVFSRKEKTLALALAAGADPMARSPQGRLPLTLACSFGNIKMARLLLAPPQCDPNARDLHGRAAMHAAAQARRPDLIALLAARGADASPQDMFGETPLHIAASRGAVETAQALVQNGARLDLFDDYWRSPLMAALRKNNNDAFAPLLWLGADPNARHPAPEPDPKKNQLMVCTPSALGYAISGHKLSAAVALLDAGADPNAPYSNDNWTLLSPLEQTLLAPAWFFEPVFAAMLRANVKIDAIIPKTHAKCHWPECRPIESIAYKNPAHSNLICFLRSKPDLETPNASGHTILESIVITQTHPRFFDMNAAHALIDAGARITPKLLKYIRNPTYAAEASTAGVAGCQLIEALHLVQEEQRALHEATEKNVLAPSAHRQRQGL